MMDDTRTLQYIRRLRPYTLGYGTGNTDPHVQEIFESKVDKETLEALHEYTSGMYSEELHMKSLMNYDRSTAEDDLHTERLLSHPSFEPAVHRILYELRNAVTIPIPPSNLDEVKFQPGSSAGFGYIGKKRDNYPLARRNASRALYDYEKWRHNYRFVPDKAYARCQLVARADPKVRHIWGHPFHSILIEGCIAYPIIKSLLSTPTPIYIGRDLHKELPFDVIQLMNDGGYCYCLDFSRFDSLLCKGLISAAWDIIYYLCPPQTAQDQLVYDYSRQLFQNNPILMPNGDLYICKSGLPSGSYFTQIVGSLCNLILIYMFLHSHGYPNALAYVLGDDSIFVLPHNDITIDHCYLFFDWFGMIVNLVKSIITKNYADIVFLGHNFYGSRVSRMEFTCLSLALFSENPITGIHHTLQRVASLLYDSGFNSFGLYNLYKELNDRHQIDWDHQDTRPASVIHPYSKLFVLS